MKKIIQKQLGQLLIDCNLLKVEQLELALKTQKEKGGLIGQILVQLGFVNEEQIAKALTAQYGFPYLPLVSYEIDPEVAKCIPAHVAKQYELIAVDRVGNVLTLSMSNPLNSQAVEDVEMITHCKAQVFVSTAADINLAIKKYY